MWACHRVKEDNIDYKIGRAVKDTVLTVESCMHDAILAAMHKMVNPRVEMTVRSITGSWGHGPNREVQNPDRRDFIGNVSNNPLMSAFSRLDLNTSQHRNDETRSEENFEDGDVPAINPNYDRRTQAHHSNYHISKNEIF